MVRDKLEFVLKFVNRKVTKCYDNKEVPRTAHQDFT